MPQRPVSIFGFCQKVKKRKKKEKRISNRIWRHNLLGKEGSKPVTATEFHAGNTRELSSFPANETPSKGVCRSTSILWIPGYLPEYDLRDTQVSTRV